MTFVLHMLTDTELVWGSIQTYVWGVRTWMQSQHQAARPWRFVPGYLILSYLWLEAVNLESFQEVQLAPCASFSRTFSRTETPSARAPKAFSGREIRPGGATCATSRT